MFNKLHDLHSLTLCSTNYMTCTVLHYVQQTTWLAQSYTTFNKLHKSYTMFNKLHESYTMFNKLHDLHSLTLHSTNYISLTLCSTNYMSLTLCSTNYMTCTVLHYNQQTTWVLHYVQQTTWVFNFVQQTTWLAQSYTMFNKLHESYTMFNKLHHLHSLSLHSTNYTTCTVTKQHLKSKQNTGPFQLQWFSVAILNTADCHECTHPFQVIQKYNFHEYSLWIFRHWELCTFSDFHFYLRS